MSPLSKAFVVLATLLSVVMVVLTVGFAAQTENYREKFGEASADLQVAQSSYARQNTVLSGQLAELRAALSARENADNGVNAQLAAKLGEIRSRDERISNLEATNARTTAALAAATETLQASNARSDAQDGQIRDLISDMATLARQKSEAEQAVVAAIGLRDRYENEVRRLQEQLVALETQRAELSDRVDELEVAFKEINQDPDAVIGTTGIRIAGAVTSVDQIGDGLTLVELNVGTRDGVKADMPFTIFRGDQYVGTIRITTVDTDKAVGEVTLSTDTVRDGDSAQTGR